MEKMKIFKSWILNLIKSAQRNDPDKLRGEYAMRYLARSIKNLPDKLWTLIKFHELYKENKEEVNKYSRCLSKPIVWIDWHCYV